MTSIPVLPPQIFTLLRERFGFAALRPGQEPVIAALLAGQNVLAVMPTGSGKSLCYQLPALLHDGCTVVISPLIALMKDQVDGLQAQGIAATFVNSSLSTQEQQTRLHACRAGAYRLLYIAPERLRNPRFLHAMAQTRVSLFAVDEAHCISEWGHDFRPDYLRLRQAIEFFGQPRVLALTATATVEVQHDIVQQLGCSDMQRFVTGFDRTNLTYRVLTLNTAAAKLQTLADILAAQTAGSSIVYAATRRVVEEVAAFLHERGMVVLSYHAGLPDGVRRQTQETFMERPHGIIVATNAFGMGVDKADVRSVVHFHLPRSMEAYYQEAGRAGRDGLPAQCILLFSYGDVKVQEFLLEQSSPPRELIEAVYERLVAQSRQQVDVPLRALWPGDWRGGSEMQLAASVKLLENAGYVERVTSYNGVDDTAVDGPAPLVRLATEPVAVSRLALDYATLQRRKQHEIQKLRRMVGYANARQCRRQRILSYFGEAWQQRNCGACDYCLQEGTFDVSSQYPTRPPTEAEWLLMQKILSCVARMRGRYGRAKVVQVLLGSRAKDIRESHLTALSTYGILHGTPRSTIETFIEALLAAECLEVVGDEFPKLGLTARGQAVMRRQQSIQLALPSPAPARGASHAAMSPPVTSIPAVTPEVVLPAASADTPTAVVGTATATDYDSTLFERLRAQRTALAQAEAVPPYCVFADRTLREMATHLPADHTALRQIHGVGDAKVRKYGDIFLGVIRDYRAQHAS
jgi:ATP-dependent DNA helicase RecQ